MLGSAKQSFHPSVLVPIALAVRLRGLQFKEDSEHEIDMVVFSMMVRIRKNAKIIENDLGTILDYRMRLQFRSAAILLLIAVVFCSVFIAFYFYSILNVISTILFLGVLIAGAIMIINIARKDLYEINDIIQKTSGDLYVFNDALSNCENLIKSGKTKLLAKIFYEFNKDEMFLQKLFDDHKFEMHESSAKSPDIIEILKSIEKLFQFDRECAPLFIKLDKCVIIRGEGH